MLLLIVVSLIALVDTQHSNVFGQRPNYKVDEIYARYVDTDFGPTQGFAVPYEAWWDDRFTHKSQADRVIDEMGCFLGIPYAKPPIGELRFKDPQRPDPWMKDDPFNRKGRYNATYYRPICPQDDSFVKLTYKGYLNYVNVSEDCLYLNIFAPNITAYKARPDHLYSVLVYVHGGEFADFNTGAAQQFPGFILAQKGVIVVTFNYRLGALGFLTTENQYANGNFGFKDIIMALEWVKYNVGRFRGNADQVTVIGHDSGAAMVSMMLISPLTRGRNLFNRAIIMSGADMCDWAYIDEAWRPRDYAHELGHKLGCPFYREADLMNCLRNARKDMDLVNAGNLVKRRPGARSGPWAITVHKQSDVLDDLPRFYRDNGYMDYMPILGGQTKTEGARILQKYEGRFVNNTVSKDLFRDIIYKEIISQQNAYKYNDRQLLDAIEFEYTYWANLDNKTAQMENLVSTFSDYLFGSGIDGVMKSQIRGRPAGELQQYSYVFDYRSNNSRLARWMGVPHGDDLPYVFGFPMLNKTIQEMFYVDLSKFNFSKQDQNFSDYMMTMWVNFATSGGAKPITVLPQQIWPVYNFTWWAYNSTYLATALLFEWPHHVFFYHIDHYGFWSKYFPDIVEWAPIQSTTQRIPDAYYSYQAATWSLAAVLVLCLFVVGALVIVLVNKTRRRYTYN